MGGKGRGQDSKMGGEKRRVEGEGEGREGTFTSL